MTDGATAWAAPGGACASVAVDCGRLSSSSHPDPVMAAAVEKTGAKAGWSGGGDGGGPLSLSLLGAGDACERKRGVGRGDGGDGRECARWSGGGGVRGRNSGGGARHRRHDPVMAATVEKASAKARRISGNGGAPPLSLSPSSLERKDPASPLQDVRAASPATSAPSTPSLSLSPRPRRPPPPPPSRSLVPSSPPQLPRPAALPLHFTSRSHVTAVDGILYPVAMSSAASSPLSPTRR